MADENIRIRLTAVDKTRSGLASVTRGLRSVTSAVFSMRTAIASLVGAGGIGLIVKQSISATDTLAKTASRIGTTTHELSKLQFAAELSGLSIEQANMALQRFARRTAEAAQGTGEAQGALRELGLDARVLSSQPLGNAMLDLADAFSQVESGTDQLRLAFKLFDSEGAGMINMLNKGSDALVSMYAEARTLGIIMSTSVAHNVERTADAFTKLQYLFRGIRDQIVGALAPALELIANKIRSFFESLATSKGGIEEWAKTITAKFLTGIASLLEGFALATLAVQNFVNGFIDMINYVRDFMDLEKLGYVTFNVGTQAGEAAKNLREMAAAVLQVGEGLSIGVPKGNETVSMFTRMSDAIRRAVETIPEIDQLFTSFTQGAMNSFTQGFTDAITGAKNFADAVKDMAKSVIDSLIKMLVQYYITKPLFDALTGFIGNAGAGGGAAVAGARAVGGPVSAGSPYLVGENGPELFVPSAGGQIVPNGRMGGGGVTVNQNINISTGVAQTVRAEVANLMPQIAQTAKAAVAEAKMRGGNYSKSLVGA